MKKRIASNYIYNLIYQIVIVFSSLVSIPYLVRVLGSTNLGIYSYTYSIVTIFFLLGALGINTYGQREIAYTQDDIKKRSRVFFELVILRIFTTIISLILLFIFSLVVSEYSIYYKIFSIYIISNIFDITWFYQGMENFKSISLRSIFIKIIYIISLFIFVKNKNDLSIYILLFSISTLIINLSLFLGIRKNINKVELNSLNVKRHIKPVLLLFIPSIASLIYTVLDKTMIGLMVPEINNVSFYEQACYIDKTILLLITTIGTIMVSKMSYSYEKKNFESLKYYMKKIINFVWLFGSALMFGVCSIISNFVPWFYGYEYSSVINLVYIMSLLIIVIGLNNVIGIQYLVSTKQQNKYVIAIVIGCIINFILNLILINKIGTIGASISSVIAEAVILFIELYFVRKVISIKDVFLPSIKYILFGLIMFIPTYLIGDLLGSTIISTIIQIIVGIIIYVSLLLVSKDKFLYENVFGYLKSIKNKN